MNKNKTSILVAFIALFMLSSFNPIGQSRKTKINCVTERISFKIKGTGSKGISVKIGVGSQVGSGSCCSTVSPNSTTSFSGNIGDVVYDSEKKRVIVKIYDGLQGTIIDLKEYY
jgi:hypothetical protein